MWRMTWYSSGCRCRRACRAPAGDVERLAAVVALDDRDHLGAALPSSFRRPTRRQPCRPSVISVCMSASFFWISWLAASGRPNCLRSSVYWRARASRTRPRPARPRRCRSAPVEAAERPLRPSRWAAAFVGHEHVVHHDLAGDRGAQLSLPSIFGADRPFMPFSSTKPRILLSSGPWPRPRRRRRSARW
jgi:hypothetical protein